MEKVRERECKVKETWTESAGALCLILPRFISRKQIHRRYLAMLNLPQGVSGVPKWTQVMALENDGARLLWFLGLRGIDGSLLSRRARIAGPIPTLGPLGALWLQVFPSVSWDPQQTDFPTVVLACLTAALDY